MIRLVFAATLATAFLPSSGIAQSAIGVRGPLGTLNLSGGQSSSRSISSSSAFVTSLNGYPASFYSGVVRPFVIGVTPVVGDYPTVVDRSAVMRQQQLSKLYQSQADARSRRLTEYLRRAERAEFEGNLRMARANYRRAVGLASGPLKNQIILKLKIGL